MDFKAFWKILFLVVFITGTVSCSNNDNRVIQGPGSEVIDFKVIPFEIEDVKLLDGEFKHATDLNQKILLEYEPDRFLAKFRIEAGLEPKAEHYRGWESNTIAGHSLGHYLTSMVLMYETTGEEEYKTRAEYIVDELYLCSQADEDGYIGAFENGKKIFDEEVATGDIRAQGFNLNGIWAPFYTMHKIFDGLMHCYYHFENEKALEVATRFAGWIGTVVKDLSDEEIQKMLHCEHGGINESLVELYGITSEEKYLELSKVFQHTAIIDPITEGEDILPGKHSNTQIPKFIGLARRYELTGDEKDRLGAENFWNMMVHHHTYVTGGNGNHEYLGKPDELSEQLSDNTTETCNVYNMLKLSEHYFEWTVDPEIMDFYERALINHIRSSQHPESGHVIYNLSIDMGGFKVYQNPHWFTCCVGSGMENHSKYSKNIYYHNHEELYLVQFISSELNWEEKGIKLTQKTSYPESDEIHLEFSCEKSVGLDLKIRYPGWAKNGISLKVNGKAKKVKEEAGEFITLSRTWKDGDQVDIQIPFSLRIETMPDNPNRIAIFNGPVVLAGILGPVPDEDASDPFYVPVLMTKDPDPANWLSPVEDTPNTFKLTDVAEPRVVDLMPFYRTHDHHYTIFWDTFTAEEWKKHQEEYEAELKRKKELELNTIDLFRVGEMQPERDHNFIDEKSWVNEFKSKKSREADRGGWFAFDLKVNKGEDADLVIEYWGGFTGSKTFDIYVEDKKIATENISNKAPGKFIDVVYDIPAEIIVDKQKINVKFVPHDGHRAGPVFTARTVKID